jgi:hypothetical protein
MRNIIQVGGCAIVGLGQDLSAAYKSFLQPRVVNHGAPFYAVISALGIGAHVITSILVMCRSSVM